MSTSKKGKTMQSEKTSTSAPSASRGYPICCPILEQTADGGRSVGRCWMTLDGAVCPRHGEVAVECERFADTGECTLENTMRFRKGLPRLG